MLNEISPLLFKLHITQLYCRKEKEKFEKNKFLAAQKPGKQFFDAQKCHVINFFLVCSLVLLSQKTKI